MPNFAFFNLVSANATRRFCYIANATYAKYFAYFVNPVLYFALPLVILISYAIKTHQNLELMKRTRQIRRLERQMTAVRFNEASSLISWTRSSIIHSRWLFYKLWLIPSHQFHMELNSSTLRLHETCTRMNIVVLKNTYSYRSLVFLITSISSLLSIFISFLVDRYEQRLEAIYASETITRRKRIFSCSIYRNRRRLAKGNRCQRTSHQYPTVNSNRFFQTSCKQIQISRSIEHVG